jgi:hypothetical protein
MKSDSSVRDLLVQAAAIVESAELPESYRPSAFEYALGVLSGSARGPQRDARTPEAAEPGANLTRMASKLDLDPESIAEVYADDEKGPQVIVGVGKLEDKPALATKQLALLVAGGRQAAGIEEWTESSVIRKTCEDYGRLDLANFASTLSKMADFFSFRGQGAKRELRINRAGLEELKRQIAKLTGRP